MTRINEFLDILNIVLKESPRKEIKFRDHDAAFIFGDLNFRIDLDYFQCRSMIKAKKYDLLQSFDQFKVEKSKNPSLLDIEEGELDFDPTYKFDLKTNEYDTSKKQRVPSWCDRIFWKKNKNIQILKYGSAFYLNSDHRPIYGLFRVKYSKTFDDIIKNSQDDSKINSNQKLESYKNPIISKIILLTRL